MERGLVLNIQRYSIHDGPGIRTTVFLKGCPLSCWWCHNPESQSPAPEILVVESLCVRCGRCREVCPLTDGEPCRLCGACVEACPPAARQWAGREMSVADVLDQVRRDRLFYEESGGGVTVSGGEPLTQPAFARALLAACRAEGLPTALDTCGYGSQEDLLAAAELADVVLYDLKLVDDARHRLYTGVPSEPILRNLRALGAVHKNIWLRVPLVPGINDAPADLDAIAAVACETKGLQQVNLLAYHGAGAAKFERLGRPYRLASVAAPTPEQMDRAAGRLRQFGLNVKTGG